MSGNKFLGYFLVPLLLISCGAFKKTQKTEWPKDDAVIVVNPQNSEDETAVEVSKKNDTEKEATIYSSVIFKGQSYR
ncbi:MAG: hypothetical protein QMC70_04225, partial [Bacteroidia bacterium]